MGRSKQGAKANGKGWHAWMNAYPHLDAQRKDWRKVDFPLQAG
jgi:hypothetical protein